jgi:hypothetical protein
MISTRIRQTKHIAFGLGLLLCTSLASAAQISAGSTIAFFGISSTSGNLPDSGAGSLSVTSAQVAVTTDDFDVLVPVGSAATFANPISWDATGAITAPASGATLWNVSSAPLASFILGSGTASQTDAGLLEIVATGTLTLLGYDDTPGSFVFNETGLTFSSQTVSEVPLPAAVWLFGTALLGLGAIRRRPEAK